MMYRLKCMVIVEIWANKTKMKVANLYNPCQKLTKVMLEGIWERGNGKVIICGDFNAHSSLWGSTRTDENGKIIEEYMDEHNLVCLNDGRGTRFDVGRGTESAIDLTIVSEQIAGSSQWEVFNDNSMGSDHYPIWTKMSDQSVQLEGNWFPRWKMKEVNWEHYSMVASGKLMGIMSNLGDDVEELNSMITGILYESAEETIGKSTGMKKMVPWWSEGCKEAIKARNKAFKVIKLNHTFNKLIEYKKAQAKAKRVICEAKRKYWRDFCSNIGSEIKVSEVWGMIRKMGGNRRDFALPVIRGNDIEAVTNAEKAEVLDRAFVKVHSKQNLSSEELRWKAKVIEENRGILGRKVTNECAIDTNFSLFELKRALIGVKSTSPGKDEVCYKMIEQLSDVAKSVVLILYNKIWEQGKLPGIWKHSAVIPIGKPGKDKTEVKSYRPIALTSNLCKIMEKMITIRLGYVIEKRGMLSPHQSGFRNGRPNYLSRK